MRGLFAVSLEVSTKSEDNLGVQLSAFNLKIRLKNGHEVPLENVFHSSKVFQHGGPFKSLLALPAGEAKRDERLTNNGKLIGFTSNGFDWPLTPKTIFYDWLYINTVMTYPELLSELEQFNAFSDIEFNPKKSINCQARSAALLVSLHKQGLLEKYTADANSFLINLSKPHVPKEHGQTDMFDFYEQ